MLQKQHTGSKQRDKNWLLFWYWYLYPPHLKTVLSLFRAIFFDSYSVSVTRWEYNEDNVNDRMQDDKNIHKNVAEPRNVKLDSYVLAVSCG